MLTIAAICEATSFSEDKMKAMLPAFQTQLNRDLAPVWGTQQIQIAFTPKGKQPAAGSWWLVFLDDSDQADALAYHDLTNDGLPISKVFVRTLLRDKASISVGATHELCEMMVDPWLNGAYEDSHGTFWAAECADPFEADQYGYEIDGVLVTDFATPKWFGYQHEKGAVDFCEHSKTAFSVLSGGYAQQRRGSGDWKQITGREAKSFARAAAPNGSRRDRRLRGVHDWVRSKRHFE
jgi:hypothetical protein